MVGAVVP